MTGTVTSSFPVKERHLVFLFLVCILPLLLDFCSEISLISLAETLDRSCCPVSAHRHQINTPLLLWCILVYLMRSTSRYHPGMGLGAALGCTCPIWLHVQLLLLPYWMCNTRTGFSSAGWRSRGLKFIFEFNWHFFNIERCPILLTCELWMILRDLALALCYEVRMLQSRHNYITHNSRGLQSGIQAPPARAVCVTCWSDGFTCEKWQASTDLPYKEWI